MSVNIVTAHHSGDGGAFFGLGGVYREVSRERGTGRG